MTKSIRAIGVICSLITNQLETKVANLVFADILFANPLSKDSTLSPSSLYFKLFFPYNIDTNQPPTN